MPTGYTYPVVEGKVTEFRDFAMQCARAFGALIEMRDAPNDAPIPEKFEPQDSYSTKRLAEATRELAELDAMTTRDVIEAIEKEHQAVLASNADSRAKQAEENARIDRMLEQVRDWIPPTKEHVGLKKFMIEQLEMSRSTWEIKDPLPPLISTWRSERRRHLVETIARAKQDREEEIQRANERTAWVRALRESLNG